MTSAGTPGRVHGFGVARLTSVEYLSLYAPCSGGTVHLKYTLRMGSDLPTFSPLFAH